MKSAAYPRRAGKEERSTRSTPALFSHPSLTRAPRHPRPAALLVEPPRNLPKRSLSVNTLSATLSVASLVIAYASLRSASGASASVATADQARLSLAASKASHRGLVPGTFGHTRPIPPALAKLTRAARHTDFILYFIYKKDLLKL